MAVISVPAGWANGAGSRGAGSRRASKGVASGGRSGVSLTPRAIKLLTGAAVAVALVTTTGAIPGMWEESVGGPGETAPQRVVEVHAGDSLWSIATRTMPDVETADAVDQLKALNGPQASKLMPGQQLVIPGYVR